jgi:hypothetical protein
MPASTLSTSPAALAFSLVNAAANAPSHSASRSRTCSHCGFVHDVRNPPSENGVRITLRRSACSTGNDFRISASTIEKIAVLAPIPSARERMAMPVTKGVESSERTAWRRASMEGRSGVAGRAVDLRVTTVTSERLPG